MRGRAGFVSRGVAFAVDVGLLAVVAYGIVAFSLLLRDLIPRAGPKVPVGAISLALAPVLFAAYHAAFWMIRGATPGQWLLGIQVVSLGGGRVRPRHALARVLGYLVSALPFYLGFLWALGPSRRAWHDILAGTEVIYAADGTAVLTPTVRPAPARGGGGPGGTSR